VLGAVHKRNPQSGGLSSADVLWTRQEGAVWRIKLRIFRNLLCVRTDKGKRGGGQFFVINVFYRRSRIQLCENLGWWFLSVWKGVWGRRDLSFFSWYFDCI